MATVSPRRPLASTRTLGVLWALAVAVACDPLATEDYEGEPLGTLEGGVFEELPGLIHRDDLRAAVFWSPDEPSAASTTEQMTEQTTDELETLVEQPGTAQPVGIPNDYVLHLFDPPPAEVLLPTSDGQGVYAIGRILVYPDEDGDGRRGADEPFLGAMLYAAVLYAPAPLPATTSPTGRDLPAGIHTTVLPLACTGEALRPVTEDCGVELGAPCETDDDCGALGSCLTTQSFLTFPWPGGVCAVARLERGCHPHDAGLVAALPGGSVRAWWVAGCATDADCEREEPYVCDVGAAACVPDVPLRISLAVEPEPAPFCATPPAAPAADPPPAAGPAGEPGEPHPG